MSKKTSITAGQLKQCQRFLEDSKEKALEVIQKFSKEEAQRFIENYDKYQERDLTAIREFSVNSQKRAQKIMGNNFFGVEDAIKYFGIKPDEKQIAALDNISFSESVLEELKDTHILVAVFPISILDIRKKVPKELFYSHEDSWYNKESFAKDSGDIGWKLICKTPAQNSVSKNYQEQQALLGKQEEVPSAQAVVYTIMGHYLKTSERLFEDLYVRTSSLDSDGDHVSVGDFVSDGLDVSCDWDGDRCDNLGLASARK